MLETCQQRCANILPRDLQISSDHRLIILHCRILGQNQFYQTKAAKFDTFEVILTLKNVKLTSDNDTDRVRTFKAYKSIYRPNVPTLLLQGEIERRIDDEKREDRGG
jgi:hypothetical protein